jgi:predicted SnoaL-like aldol condensation-catalyzing enzyme
MSNEQNMAALRRIIEEGFGHGNLEVVDELFDASMVEHQAGIDSPNREGVKAAIKGLHRSFPDIQYTFEHLVADGDLVWAHMKGRATHLGPFGPLPPTGKTIEIDVIDIARFQNGKVVEHWGVPDRLSLLEQLGLAPGRRPPSG